MSSKFVVTEIVRSPHVFELSLPNLCPAFTSQSTIPNDHIDSAFNGRVQGPHSIRGEEKDPRVVLQDAKHNADHGVSTLVG